MTYREALDYLYNRLPVFHISGASAYKPGLENTVRLLDALGNPHTRFKSIHIAGTNGKGSVSHYLAAILQQAGYKTGLYTSPHLVDFGERIRINGEMIDQQYVVVRYENQVEALCRMLDFVGNIYGTIFTKTKIGAKELTDELNSRGYPTDALHGDIS